MSETPEEQIQNNPHIARVQELLETEKTLDEIAAEMGLELNEEEKEPDGIYFVHFSDGPVQAKCGRCGWAHKPARDKVAMKAAMRHHNKKGCPVTQEED
jgi:hypothetical protein